MDPTQNWHEQVKKDNIVGFLTGSFNGFSTVSDNIAIKSHVGDHLAENEARR